MRGQVCDARVQHDQRGGHAPQAHAAAVLSGCGSLCTRRRMSAKAMWSRSAEAETCSEALGELRDVTDSGAHLCAHLRGASMSLLPVCRQPRTARAGHKNPKAAPQCSTPRGSRDTEGFLEAARSPSKGSETWKNAGGTTCLTLLV